MRFNKLNKMNILRGLRGFLITRLFAQIARPVEQYKLQKPQSISNVLLARKVNYIYFPCLCIIIYNAISDNC